MLLWHNFCYCSPSTLVYISPLFFDPFSSSFSYARPHSVSLKIKERHSSSTGSTPCAKESSIQRGSVFFSTIFFFVIQWLIFWLIGTQYQVVDVVGEGAYGIVCSAVHRPSGRKVAIKKIAPFEHSMFCLRTLRELKLLKFLSEAGVSENVRSRVFFFQPHRRSYFSQDYLHSGYHQTTLVRSIQRSLSYVLVLDPRYLPS